MLPPVTTRNLLRLLRAGIFGREEQVEPLSAWKWQRLYQLSVMHGVTALVYDGMQRCHNQFFFQMPENQHAQWEAAAKAVEHQNQRLNIRVGELAHIFADNHWRALLFKGQSLATYYDHPQHRTPGDADFFFPEEVQADDAALWAEDNGKDVAEGPSDNLRYQWQGISVEHHSQLARLTNPLRNRTLQQIIDRALSEAAPAYVVVNGARIETAPPTLNLLLIVIRVTKYLLSDGITMKQLSDLAVFLDKHAGSIDFDMLAKWVERLKLQGVVQLIGALTAETMGLDEELIPFLQKDGSPDIDRVVAELSELRGEWRSSGDQSLFSPNDNSPALFRRTRHSARYFSYYPSETLTSFLSSLARIEE